MSMFLCLLRLDGGPVMEDTMRAYSARPAARTCTPGGWSVQGEWATLTGSDIATVQPTTAKCSGFVGVGIVRLDDREAVARDIGAARKGWTDLQLVLGILAKSGSESIASLSGEFSFVAFDRKRHVVIAARDPFGVRRLYVTHDGPTIALSTRASLITKSGAYDMEYFAEYLVDGYDFGDHTTFADVRAIRCGEVAQFDIHSEHRTRYWPGANIAESTMANGPAIVAQFRSLLFDAVRQRVTRPSETWAQLSGGMDSSSIVAAAAALGREGGTGAGLAGTLTYVTRPAIGGDRTAAEAVARHCDIRQVIVGDWWLWQDDGEGVPLTDQPVAALAAYASNRRVTRLVRAQRGTTLLCGAGADLYLRRSLHYTADLVAQGHVAAAIREVTAWAATTRLPFWGLAFEHAVLPLLPMPVRRALVRSDLRIPKWLPRAFRQRYSVAGRSAIVRMHAGRLGHKQFALILGRLQCQGDQLPPERIGEDNLDWRYPFLYRPLVDMALHQPRDQHAGLGTNKRLLRAATNGLLPDPVRLRVGKGGLAPQPAYAIGLERARIALWLKDPILAQMGCLDPDRFREAVQRIEDDGRFQSGRLASVLTAELWLRRQAGLES